MEVFRNKECRDDASTQIRTEEEDCAMIGAKKKSWVEHKTNVGYKRMLEKNKHMQREQKLEPAGKEKSNYVLFC